LPDSEQDVATDPVGDEAIFTEESTVSRNLIQVAVGAAFCLVATAIAPSPVRAETCPISTTCATTMTFTVTASGLTVSVPGGPVSIGSGAPGNNASGQLGSITVSDQRAVLAATWTATASATDFQTGGGTAAETITNGDVMYWSGPATATTGNGTFVPGQPSYASAEHLDEPYTVFSKTSGSGNNSATWNPTLVVHIPDDAVAGTYTGTVNHSVA
jgi:hypothetical protein